jgi:hypothetical protein
MAATLAKVRPTMSKPAPLFEFEARHVRLRTDSSCGELSTE